MFPYLEIKSILLWLRSVKLLISLLVVNSAIGYIQKALQKYVGFIGMDPEYCDRIRELMDRAQARCQDIEELYKKAEVYSINTSKGDATDVGIFSYNSQVTVFEFLESAELAYLGWGNSIQKGYRLYNKHLSDEIKSRLINISDNYSLMKTWLITNYGGPAGIVGDIVGNLSRKSKPVLGNRRDKFSFYSAITGSIQRLERLSRVRYINGVELEACLLSRNRLSSLVSLLPTSKYDFWVREMTVSELDSRNPVGAETLYCSKKVCIIERNTNKGSRSDPSPKEVQNAAVKKVMKTTYKVQQQEEEGSGIETESTVYAMAGSNPKPWNPPSGLKFPCPMADHKHEVSMCAEFFALSPLDRWEKIDKGRICFSCLKPKTICRSRKCTSYGNVPKF